MIYRNLSEVISLSLRHHIVQPTVLSVDVADSGSYLFQFRQRAILCGRRADFRKCALKVLPLKHPSGCLNWTIDFACLGRLTSCLVASVSQLYTRQLPCVCQSGSPAARLDKCRLFYDPLLGVATLDSLSLRLGRCKRLFDRGGLDYPLRSSRLSWSLC
jgi:hypothetical protein